MEKVTKVKCKGCGKTIAHKIEDKIELKCIHCGEKNIISKKIDIIVTPHLLE